MTWLSDYKVVLLSKPAQHGEKEEITKTIDTISNHMLHIFDQKSTMHWNIMYLTTQLA